LNDMGGIDLETIPFDGGGEVVTNLLGGHVDIAFLRPRQLPEHVEAGNLRPIATSSDEALESFPEVPTLTEEGLDITLQQPRGVILPDDVSDEEIAFYEELFRQVSETEEWQEFVKEDEMVSDFMGYEEFTEHSYELNDMYMIYTEGLND